MKTSTLKNQMLFAALLGISVGCTPIESEEDFDATREEAISAGANTLPAGTTGTKWFPGHYVSVRPNGTAHETYEQPRYTAALNHPNVRGLMVHIRWNALEGATKGSYDFSILDEYLNAAGAKGKKVMLRVYDRSFINQPNGNLPHYVVANGCSFPLANQKTANPNDAKGLALKWYKPACASLEIDLYKALAARYDRDTRFAGAIIGVGESALEISLASDYTDKVTHVEQYMRAVREVKAVFPHTLVAFGFNGGVMGYGIEEMAQNFYDTRGSAFTHPDSKPGAYYGKGGMATQLEIDHIGEIPLIAEMQQTSLPNSGDTAGIDAPQQWSWVKTKTKPAFTVWGDGRQGVADYVADEVLPFLSTAAASFPASQGACPSRVIAPCLTQ